VLPNDTFLLLDLAENLMRAVLFVIGVDSYPSREIKKRFELSKDEKG